MHLKPKIGRFYHPKLIQKVIAKMFSFVREIDFKSIRLRMELDTG